MYVRAEHRRPNSDDDTVTMTTPTPTSTPTPVTMIVIIAISSTQIILIQITAEVLSNKPSCHACAAGSTERSGRTRCCRRSR